MMNIEGDELQKMSLSLYPALEGFNISLVGDGLVRLYIGRIHSSVLSIIIGNYNISAFLL
jgi:hypothetical protein